MLCFAAGPRTGDAIQADDATGVQDLWELPKPLCHESLMRYVNMWAAKPVELPAVLPAMVEELAKLSADAEDSGEGFDPSDKLGEWGIKLKAKPKRDMMVVGMPKDGRCLFHGLAFESLGLDAQKLWMTYSRGLMNQPLVRLGGSVYAFGMEAPSIN